MTSRHWLATAILSLAALTACGGTHSVNGAVHIAAGEHTGEVTSVNGSIQIDAQARVAGVRSVNGSQSLGEGAHARSMSAVNGTISIAPHAEVSGDVACVNCSMSLASGAEVGGTLASVNGPITVDGAQVQGRLRTVNGAITLLNGARIEGGILMKKTHGFSDSTASRIPRVVIGRDVTVNGTLKFEREVRLYISDQVKHLGPIEGATPITYTGDTPPE